LKGSNSEVRGNLSGERPTASIWDAENGHMDNAAEFTTRATELEFREKGRDDVVWQVRQQPAQCIITGLHELVSFSRRYTGGHCNSHFFQGELQGMPFLGI
jgi:hypothetical protein